MNFFMSMPIEQFLQHAIYLDQEISQIPNTWEIEKDEVCNIALQYYLKMGIFTVKPFEHGRLMRKDLIRFLYQSKEIKQRRLKIRREIEIAREKARVRGG